MAGFLEGAIAFNKACGRDWKPKHEPNDSSMKIVLRPDAFKVSPDSPNTGQMRENIGLLW